MDNELVYALTDKYTVVIENNSDGNPLYIGEATPGTATSATGWRIKKVTYENGNPSAIEWASGTTEFDKTWEYRASYDYS